MDVYDGKTYKEFMDAVKTNDVDKVNTMLQSRRQKDISLDINGVDKDKKTPLIVAIESNQTGVVSQLLTCGANTDDALMYAIEICSEPIVTLLCEHLSINPQKILEDELDHLCTDNKFKPLCNPLMFASRQNYHGIVKTLIRYGATIPDQQIIMEYSKGDSYEECLASIGWHQALSSEAYILYSSNDPLQAAINAGKAIQKAKYLMAHHLRDDFDQLLESLDQFVTKLVGQSNSEKDISRLLWSDTENNNNNRSTKVGVLPTRLHDFIDLDYRQFVSSTTCQHFVLDQWYMEWKDTSMLSFVLWTLAVVFFQPLLCLSYMFLPLKLNRRIVKTPYVRFLVHLVSRLYFLFFILYITIHSSEAAYLDKNEREMIRQAMFHFIKPPNAAFVLAYVWILGMTWRELREFFSGGFKSYWKDAFNYSDVLQLILYWLALVFSTWSYIKRRGEFNELCKYVTDVDFASDSSFFLYDIYDEFGICEDIKNMQTRQIENITSDETGFMDGDIKKPSEGFGANGEDQIQRFPFDPNDPMLISEALFAVATVLSFLALLRDFVIVAFVGPLRTSLGGMISDIIRFFVLFIFVWISFSLGMTQLYTTYDIVALINCQEEEECPTSAFITLSDSLSTLFWSLFNPIDEETLQIDQQYQTIFILGEVLYAIYMVVVVVVMLNALIAMMSNTYTRVEENSDIEWKFARTNVMAEYMTTTASLPPPFNLLPTVRMILHWLSSARNKISSCCRTHDSEQRQSVRKQSEMIALQEEEESYKVLVDTLVNRFLRTYKSSDVDGNIDTQSMNKLSDEISGIKSTLQQMESKMDLLLGYFEKHTKRKSSLFNN